MKTQITTLAISIWILLMGTVLMANPGNPNANSYSRQILNEEIEELIQFPEFAKEQKMDGLVLVEFEINEYGKIEVTQMNASCPKLASYVENQLETLWIADPYVKGTHHFKFNFNYLEG
jgi:hypothetical protein